MEVYLDNSATTRVDNDVTELMVKVMREDFGNPSSKHIKGVEAERYLRTAREQIAKTLKADEKEIIFTSGGTESNNLAITGTALAHRRRGKHIITTRIEHDSVLQTMKFLESEGYEVSYLGADREGHIDLDELKSLIREDTILVSVMHVNNEIGAVQDLSAVGSCIKDANPGTVFHVDAVQGYGKYNINPSKQRIDLLSVSAHKIHGPKGAGFLYKNKNIKLTPLILGGGQQGGMRSGTDNVPGAAGLGLAAENAYKHLAENTQHMMQLKDRLTDGLERLDKEFSQKEQTKDIKITVNSRKGEAGAPHIVSATFLPVKSEVLLHALEDKGIYVSAGSACSSNRKEKSHTLAAIGLDSRAQDCTLRFSLSKYTTEEETDYTLSVLKEILPVLAKFVAK